METKTWEDRKREARKMIHQRDKDATYKPETTLDMAGYDVALDGYTIHFSKTKGEKIAYLGES